MRFSNTCIIWMVVFQLFGTIPAFCRTQATPENLAIGNVWKAMRLFEQNNQGAKATNWTSINSVFSLALINRDLAGSPTYPLQEHYVFVSEKIPVLGSEMEEVVLIRTGPVDYGAGEGKREGRYLISRTPDGLKYSWLAETNVQKMLVEAGVKDLPKPEPYVPGPTDTNVIPNQYPGGNMPQPQPTNVVATPTETFAAIFSTTEPPTAIQAVPSIPSSASPHLSENQTTPKSTSASLTKLLPIALVAVLGLIVAFILFRPRKT